MTDDRTLFGQERWSATELGEALCLSTQRINQLVKEGVLPAPIDGRYLPRDAVAAYVRHLRQREDSRSQAGETTRKIQLENEIRTIKLRRIAGELVPVDRVKQDWFEISRRVRDGLLNLPSRLSGVFAAETSQEKIFESFTKEIHAVLTELSNPSAHSQTIAQRLPLDDPSGAQAGAVPEPEQSPDDETEARGDARPLQESDASLHPPTFEEAFLDRGAEDHDRFSTGD